MRGILQSDWLVLFKTIKVAVIGVAQWVGHRSANQKGGQFDSQSGHMPGLQARSPVGDAQEATNGCFSLSPSPSLPPFLKINK